MKPGWGSGRHTVGFDELDVRDDELCRAGDELNAVVAPVTIPADTSTVANVRIPRPRRIELLMKRSPDTDFLGDCVLPSPD